MCCVYKITLHHYIYIVSTFLLKLTKNILEKAFTASGPAPQIPSPFSKASTHLNVQEGNSVYYKSLYNEEQVFWLPSCPM